MERQIFITRSQLFAAIEKYIADSRVGETLSYVETAKLSAVEAAESSTSRLWGALEANCEATVTMSDMIPVASMDLAPDLGPVQLIHVAPQQFTCAEDLVAGQIVFINSRGFVEGVRDANDGLVHQEQNVDIDPTEGAPPADEEDLFA
jgi:hypothetical protein